MAGGPWHDTFLTDLADVQAFDGCRDPNNQGPSSGGQVAEDRVSARRLYKADRERLRRDKLNEQFSELANALDPNRPKNDKATILGESIQAVKDLREEVKRLKTEHASLLDESNDLTQEKKELEEEKSSLKSETDHLQNEAQQRLGVPPPWLTVNPPLMMGAAAPYPYPIPAPHVPVSLPHSDTSQVPKTHSPLVGPPSFIPMPPPCPFQLLPTLQPYAMFGSRMGEGGNLFSPFAGFPPPPPASSQFHIERPYAQYPPSIQHPVPGYAVQMSSSQSFPSSASPLHKPCVPGIPVTAAQSCASSPASKSSSDHPSAAKCTFQDKTKVDNCQERCKDVPVHNTESSVKLTELESAPPNPELKDPLLESVKSKSGGRPPTSASKEKLEFYLEQGTLSLLMAEGQVQDLANGSNDEQDSMLRPPAA